jgi:hypothetical protein
MAPSARDPAAFPAPVPRAEGVLVVTGVIRSPGVSESNYSGILVGRGEDLTMVIVSTCAYDSRGQLVRPDMFDISRAKIRLDLDTGERATFDRGHTHVFVVSDMGITAEQARERVNLRLRRFFDRAEAVRGFVKIAVKESQSKNRLNLNTTISYEILYAVEADERSRSRSPESSSAGCRRGWSTVTPG